MKRNKCLNLPVIRLEPDPAEGLTDQQVAQRLNAGWVNAAPNKAGRSTLDIIKDCCLSYFNLVFVVMAVLLLAVGSSVLNLTFMVVVVVNTVIGCVQQLRAKRAVDQLTLVAESRMQVVRQGRIVTVPSSCLVIDDIVLFGPGDQICADACLCEGQLYVNEALISGEADPVEKQPGQALRSGSFVVAGRGRARLTAVGADAYAARLAAEAKKASTVKKSEMMDALDKLIKVIGIALIPVGALLFFSQLKTGDLQGSVTATVAALVGMIPEGLYLLTSVALALSALKLTRKRVLVQDMNCIEALARTDILCVDKTGTITAPALEFEKLIPLESTDPAYAEHILAALFGDQPDNETAKAIRHRFPGPSPFVCTERIPFTSDHKFSAGVLEKEGTFLVGAPERLLSNRYAAIRAQADALIQTGARVLLVVRTQSLPENGMPDPESCTPIALLTLTGQLRPGGKETFAYFAAQGVTVKVISGDHPAAAARVAARAGIRDADRYVDATTLDTPEMLAHAAIAYTVFGRVTPEQKKALVQAMQEAGHTVAMTGDGINDVLAMKESACSVAMAGGAQAASQVARLVLLDGDFSVMPSIVDEGRRVINNIRRAASLFLVKNIFSMGLALLSLLTGLAFPIESFHMSIVSSLTIGVPGFFLALEPNYERVRGRFLANTLRGALPGGLTNIVVVLTAQTWMASLQLPQADGQAVTTAILCCVGLLVLLGVCRPFSRLRRAVWWGMTICVVGAFFVLPPITGYLRITQSTSYLVMAAMLLLAPAVLLVMNRLFDLLDRLIKKTYT